MDEDVLVHFKEWFFKYVAAYLKDDTVYDQTIRLKLEHTERVCKEIVILGQGLGLSADELLLAETVALFHDIGRFEQYLVYGTFQDANSENHAALGLRELEKHKVLSSCSEAERPVIYKSIGYHNVRILPEDEDERILFFSRLLRDADKLDIWRVFIDYYDGLYEDPNSIVVWGLQDNEVFTPEIMKALSLKKMADTRYMATLNDFKLLQVSWVFDVNFSPTFRAIRERSYIESIAATLPQTWEVLEVIKGVQEYLSERQS
ncbi:MAG: HD domain-containing protein [Deltaproteobacteria bacterium]|nr:HD domain-containing protein [Deltaproteobacteria bacterium]